MLRKGYGFCVLCAKPGERHRWEEYAAQANRSDDMVIFNRSSAYRFNFLEYEMQRGGEGAGENLNMINTLMSLHEQNKIHEAGSHGSGQGDQFWEQALKRLISRAISLLKLTGEPVSIVNMRRVVAQSFDEKDLKTYNGLRLEAGDPNNDPEKVEEALNTLMNWVKENYFLELILKLNDVEEQEGADVEEINWIRDYWLKEFAKLVDKTRGIIVESFMGTIEHFFSGVLKEKFSQGLSHELLPESIITDSKIVIVDYPLKDFGLAGNYAATIYKNAFQAALERRNVESETDPRPVALWIDEYQSFCSPNTDSLFQATARSSWVASTFLTQNLNGLYFVMGRNMPEARAKSLLGNLNLKIFCSNADFVTNQWASQMIGKTMIDTRSSRIADTGRKESITISQIIHDRVPVDHFTTLKTGRQINDFKVGAIVFKAGKLWGRERINFAEVEFDQRM